MKKTLGLIIVALLAFGIAGCAAEAEPDGYKADDFSKRPPPEGFGPGGGQAQSNVPATTGQ